MVDTYTYFESARFTKLERERREITRFQILLLLHFHKSPLRQGMHNLFLALSKSKGVVQDDVEA
jgi:hypothetical protein